MELVKYNTFIKKIYEIHLHLFFDFKILLFCSRKDVFINIFIPLYNYVHSIFRIKQNVDKLLSGPGKDRNRKSIFIKVHDNILNFMTLYLWVGFNKTTSWTNYTYSSLQPTFRLNLRSPCDYLSTRNYIFECYVHTLWLWSWIAIHSCGIRTQSNPRTCRASV